MTTLAKGALLASALLSLTLGATRAEEAAPLRLCADPANMPFSSSADSDAKAGKPGLYIEIGQEVARALGRPTETVWSLSYFGKRNLRDTMLAGRCDMAVGLPLVDDFMGPAIIFSQPILSLGYALATPKDMAVHTLADLDGKRVAVQFASPPQSLLATHDRVTTSTVMNPEEAMQLLASGQVDAAFVWGPSAGYGNAQAGGPFYVRPVDGPQMRFQAAIGFARKQGDLRDAVNAVLPTLGAKIEALEAKYGLPSGPPLQLTAADATQTAEGAASVAPTVIEVAGGRELFNGTCAHCHGPDAIQSERRINLRLLRHRYPDDTHDVFWATVHKGRISKGMPAWDGIFADDDLEKIYAYLNTVQDP